MTTITTFDNGLSCIDLLFQGNVGVIAAYLLENGGERALIEIGPSSTLDVLLQALGNVGVQPESISKVLVSHIHLDHAGAAGTFIGRFPQAHLYVHEAGAPHMVDPERLLASARRIYGDQMDHLWGYVEAVPESNIRVIRDGDVIEVGEVSLDVLYTPGHAAHHVAYYEATRKACFTGDVAAVRLQNLDYVRPPTPPPDLNLSEWRQSVERLASLEIDVLYLTHFGRFRDARAHLRQVPSRLEAWRDVLLRGITAGHDRDRLIADLTNFGNEEIAQSAPKADFSVLERYELASPYFMSVDGYLRYFKQLAPKS